MIHDELFSMFVRVVRLERRLRKIEMKKICYKSRGAPSIASFARMEFEHEITGNIIYWTWKLIKNVIYPFALSAIVDEV